MKLRNLVLAYSMLFPWQVFAAPLTLESDAHRVNLLELYTSEGCSSCPPADQWLSTLKNDDRLWDELVPVAFHVDYWDYIGWPDRFASPVYSERQRGYASHSYISTVYTPGFVLNGEEWRKWFHRPILDVRPGRKVGRLRLDIDDDHANVSFESSLNLPDKLDLHFVVLGFGLQTEVRAGENRGRTLEHDFVVLGYQRVSVLRDGETYRVTTEIPPLSAEPPRTAMAAWLSLPRDLRPLQAVGGWIP